MSCLIICVGKDYDNNIFNLTKNFDNTYIISEIHLDQQKIYINRNVSGKVSLLIVPRASAVDLSKELLKELKKNFMKDNITDLDIALNISSGSGTLHSAVLSALIKSGHGIRLVELVNGEMVEL